VGGQVASRAPWVVLDDREPRISAEQLEIDRRALALAGDFAAPSLRLWEVSDRAIVLPSRLRSATTDAARRALCASGWDMIMRPTGGSPVPQAVGMLNLSLAASVGRLPARDPQNLYTWFAEPLHRALADFGVATVFGSVPRAFCDGRHNLVAEDRKVCGLAQRWSAGTRGRQPAVLLHAVLIVGFDLEPGVDALNRALRLLGVPDWCSADAHTSLARLSGLPGKDCMRTARQRLAREFQAWLGAPSIRHATYGDAPRPSTSEDQKASGETPWTQR